MKEIKKVFDTELASIAGTYEAYVYCWNCKETNNVKILRGVSVKDVGCPNCACKALTIAD